MSSLELCYLSASQALQQFRERSLSPRELMQAIISRAEQTEPHINAFTDQYCEEALAAACAAETRYQKGKPAPRPLEGLPLVVKDDAAIKGKRSTMGSLIYKDRISSKTDPHVERLLRAGAIVHARGNCSEFCAAWITHTRAHGTTRCPWNLEFTPGGSSGGSAASLAAGATTIATGSDNAGSIRQPASACGVVGYKPPHGRNPSMGPDSLDIASVVGPLTRTVADSALMQNVMSGPHPRDITALRQRVHLPASFGSIRGMKIAYSPDLDFFSVDADVRANLDSTLDALRTEGAIVEHVKVGWSREVHDLGVEHWAHHSSIATLENFENHAELLCDYSAWYAEKTKEWVPRAFGEIVNLRARMFETFGPVLAKYDAFICPTTAVSSIPATMGPDQFFEVDGQRINADFEWCLTYPFNLLGQLPALSVPSGIASNGVPTGIQIIARAYDDAPVFKVGAAVERLRPWGYDGAARVGTV